VTPPPLAFEYLADAVHEAHEAFHWYAQRSESAADGFWEELRRARRLVTENPLTWAP
jgi:plasmid stabilization system protein ParE